MDENTNSLRLSGTVHELPIFGHEVFGEAFYHTTIAVPRLSGVADLLPVTASERLLPHEELLPGQPICIEGQLRSYNKVIAGQGRLLITAFAQKIPPPAEEENPNQISLFGTLCKQPGYRTTPFGREICDLMLAVNRAYGKSDYIPCITWGRTARFASHLKTGDKLQIAGRFQSRSYQKQLPDGTIQERTAYEVSVCRLTLKRDEHNGVYRAGYDNISVLRQEDFRSAENDMEYIGITDTGADNLKYSGDIM